jgi:hypothetical protein
MDFQTGYTGTNKQGLTFKVTDGTFSKRTKIKFDIDGREVLTTRAYLKKGLPLHPTYGKLKVGDIFKDKAGNDFELTAKGERSSWFIRFLKDGVTCKRDTDAITSGTVKHPTDGIPKIGEKYKTLRGTVEVLEYRSTFDILVKFEDGSVTKTQAADLRKGVVGHPTSGLVLGKQMTTKSGWNYQVSKYISPYEVEVLMQDNSIEIVAAGRAKDGGFKPLNQPSVCGVGYVGHGRYSSGNKKEGEKLPDVIIAYWHRMLTRCYNPAEILKDGSRNYIFVEVAEPWFCLQNFAEWALSEPNWNKSFDLDKDLIGTGSEYSPTNCTFLPAEVNIFLSETKTKPVHNLPIGVNYLKPGTAGAKVGYVSRCHTGDKREYLGYFDEPMGAYFAYKKAKENFAKILAEKHKDALTKLAYEKLKNYTLDTIYVEALDNCVARIAYNTKIPKP